MSSTSTVLQERYYKIPVKLYSGDICNIEFKMNKFDDYKIYINNISFSNDSYEYEIINNTSDINDRLESVINEFGLEVISLKSNHLKLNYQFNGVIYDPNVIQFMNESITFNAYKLGNVKIKNMATFYGFIHKLNKAILILINRQYIEDDYKCVDTTAVYIRKK